MQCEIDERTKRIAELATECYRLRAYKRIKSEGASFVQRDLGHTTGGGLPRTHPAMTDDLHGRQHGSASLDQTRRRNCAVHRSRLRAMLVKTTRHFKYVAHRAVPSEREPARPDERAPPRAARADRRPAQAPPRRRARGRPRARVSLSALHRAAPPCPPARTPSGARGSSQCTRI